MPMNERKHLSRRERQIMEIIYRLGRATVADVQQNLDDAPGYSAVRALLGILESKGQLRHFRDGKRYCYEAVVSREKARGTALRDLLHTFFGGSHGNLVAELLDDPVNPPSEQELQVIAALIERSREDGR